MKSAGMAVEARAGIRWCRPWGGRNLTKGNELLLHVKEREDHEKLQTPDPLGLEHGMDSRRLGAPVVAWGDRHVLESQLGKYGQHRRVGSVLDNGCCAGAVAFERSAERAMEQPAVAASLTRSAFTSGLSSPRELAREIVRNAADSKPGGSPTVTDLYLFLLRCLDNEAEAAERALAEYLEGEVPEAIRKRVQETLDGITTISK